MNDDQAAPASAPRGADTTMSSLLVDEPTEFERTEFVKVLAKVSATGGVCLPPFLTGQPNTFWRSLDLDPLLREVQPASDNKLGALRMRGATPGKGGDLDLCKLWVAVVSAGGVNNIDSSHQWNDVASCIALQLPAESWSGRSDSPLMQLSQLYELLLHPLEDYMESRRMVLNTLGWSPSSGLSLLCSNMDAPENPGGVDSVQYQQTSPQSGPLAPRTTSGGMEGYIRHDQELPEHNMKENRAKRKRDDTPDEENKRIKAWNEGADDLTDLVGMPHAGQDIDFSTLGSMYASQLSLERGIGDSPVRASQPLWSPEIQAAQPKQMYNSGFDPPLGLPGGVSSAFVNSNTWEPHRSDMAPIVIGRAMSTSSILEHLVKHGCPEVTNLLDIQKCGETPISSGGFSDIYHGQLSNSAQVAIECAKVFVSSSEKSRRILERSAHELYAWSKCKHANVIELLGLAQFHDQVAMVSPWMGNGSLPDYLARNPTADRCQLCVQVAEGLSYLHSVGMVHGDVKAGNVLASSDGIAKLSGFGNTTLQEYILEFAQATKKSDISLRWAAPELISEDSNGVSRESDVYALGMTMLEIITGKVPFAGKSDHAVMVAVVLRSEVPQRSDECIPSESKDGNALWALLEHCWAHRSEARPRASEIVNKMRPITQKGLLKRGL